MKLSHSNTVRFLAWANWPKIALKCLKGFEIDFWTRGGTLSGHVDSGDGPYVG